METISQKLAKAQSDLDELNREQAMALFIAASQVSERFATRRSTLLERIAFLKREADSDIDAIVPAGRVASEPKAVALVPAFAAPTSVGDLILERLADAPNGLMSASLDRIVEEAGMTQHASKKARYKLKLRGLVVLDGRYLKITDAGRAKVRGE